LDRAVMKGSREIIERKIGMIDWERGMISKTGG
jgi:hypothetical protein